MSKTESSAEELQHQQQQHMRLAITSQASETLDKVCDDFVRISKGMNLRVLGPARIPVRVVDIRTLLGPFPVGTKLIGNYKLRIYSKYIDIHCAPKVVDQIVSSFNLSDITIEIRDVGSKGRRAGDHLSSLRVMKSDLQRKELETCAALG